MTTDEFRASLMLWNFNRWGSGGTYTFSASDCPPDVLDSLRNRWDSAYETALVIRFRANDDWTIFTSRRVLWRSPGEEERAIELRDVERIRHLPELRSRVIVPQEELFQLSLELKDGRSLVLDLEPGTSNACHNLLLTVVRMQ